MIDEFNQDRTGWARFSDDRRFRYRLARSLPLAPNVQFGLTIDDTGSVVAAHRVVFLMLNPSTADAFKTDPTITECVKRALVLQADVLEVVNLFALRSSDPADLKKCAYGYRGDDSENNRQIVEACQGAAMVIAAWGNHGILDSRDRFVRNLLHLSNIELHHLGLTNGYAQPKHPLARGVHRIPADQRPIPWGGVA